MNQLRAWCRTSSRYVAATSALVPLGLLGAYLLMVWTRGIAIPILFLTGLAYTLLRSQGRLRGAEWIAVKAWALLAGFFLVGPLIIPVFRLALLALVALVVFRPGRPT